MTIGSNATDVINWGHQSGGVDIPDAKLQNLRRN